MNDSNNPSARDQRIDYSQTLDEFTEQRDWYDTVLTKIAGYVPRGLNLGNV